METEHLSLAERISKEVNLDSLAYIDKEVSIKEKRIIKSGDDAYSTDVVIISNCFIFIEYSCI